MIKQYPYDLYIMQTTAGGRDENGFPIPSTEQWVFHSKCRDIPAGAGNIVATESGEALKYASKVVMPIGTPEISANTKIKVIEGANTRLVGHVIRFSTAQLHCRLWV